MTKKIFSILILLACALSAMGQSNLPTCNVTGTIFDSNGQPFSGAIITVQKVTREGVLIRLFPQKFQTNSQGQFTIPLPRTVNVSGVVKRARAWIEAPMDGFFIPGGREVEIPNSDTAELISLPTPTLLPNQIAVAVPPITVKDEGSTILHTNILNFVGLGVNVNNSSGTAVITITGSEGGASALDDLSDVTINSPIQGQYLRRGVSGWVNGAIPAGDLPSHNHSTGDITSGVFIPGRLGSGTPSATTFLLGDSSWSVLTDALVPNTITIDNLTQITNRSYSSLQGIPSSFTPSAHASTHNSGGSDPLSLGSLAGNLGSSQHGDLSSVDASSPRHHWNQITNKPSTFVPSAHASGHHSGGADPLALGSLAGNLSSGQHGDLSGVDNSSPRHHWNQITNKPSSFAPSGHASSHQHSGSDEIATSTPANNAIPKSLGTGKLDDGWLSSNVSLLGSSVDVSGSEITGILKNNAFPSLTGDVSNSAGSVNISLTDVVSPGSCTNCNATFDSKGRVIAFSNGSGVTDDTTNQRVRVSKDGTHLGTRREINFIGGSNVTLDVTDDAVLNRVDVTINASGGGGGSGTVNSGLSGRLAIFPSDGTTVDDLTIGTGNQLLRVNGVGTGYGHVHLSHSNGIMIEHDSSSIEFSINQATSFSWSGSHTHSGLLTTAARKQGRTATSSSSYTVLSTDYIIAFTGTTQTATLPAAATAGAGAEYVFVDEARNAMASNKRIEVSGGGTIEGGTALVIDTDGNSVTVYSTGSTWKVRR